MSFGMAEGERAGQVLIAEAPAPGRRLAVAKRDAGREAEL
jgi:hypothetical protein